MAKHLDKFTRPFQDSAIPFALAEALTNGSGDVVDLVCRFLNPAAASLLRLTPDEILGRRFSHFASALSPKELAAVQTVAFSGSSASFSHMTALGQRLCVTCYQVMYGTVGLLLDPQVGAEQAVPPLPDALPGAALELSRDGLRCLACNRRLCQLTQWSQKALLDQGRPFSALVEPGDWPALLQDLLDAVREQRSVNHDLRLLRQDGSSVWVNLRAEIHSSRSGSTVFQAVFWDIDRLRRNELTLREALSQQEAAGREAARMLDRMPVGLCLLRSRPDSTVTALRANRELFQLLELTPDELERRLQADPGSFLPDGERETLLAAATQARENGRPLRRVCRICSGAGRERFFSLHISWKPQPDGGALVYIACVDASRDAAARAEHQIRAQMCDLLLEHTSLLTLDYDPAQDLALIQRHTTNGRRTSRTISGYLKSLSTAPYLHPEDRRRMAGSIRRAMTHPGTISASYRADYEGTGWRQYQVSWMSLFDERGDLRRLLGKSEDVTSRQAAAEHFRQLATRHRKQTRTCLAAARLDLTADQTLDAKAASRGLLRTLFDRTATVSLQRMAAALPDPEERRQFEALFSPAALAGAFAAGSFQLSLEHRVEAGKYGTLPVQTSAELAENPDTLRLEVFFQLRDRRPLLLPGVLLDTLASQDYEVVLTADIVTGACRAWGAMSDRLPENATCRSLAAWYFQQLPPSRERAALRKALSLEAMLAQLETAPAVDLTLPAPSGSALWLRCSRLDGVPNTLLVTCRQPEGGKPSAP